MKTHEHFSPSMKRTLAAYMEGTADESLPSDPMTGHGVLSAGTAALRDFSHIAPEIPAFDAARCTGCMECVSECPDTALLALALPEEELEPCLASLPVGAREDMRGQFARTTKYYDQPMKKGLPPARFGLFVDPAKCKGCAECVDVCGERGALSMKTKTDTVLDQYRRRFAFYESLPPTPKGYLVEKSLADMMLAERSLLFTGGAGSCSGCGEATALRMMLAATGYAHGEAGCGIVAATGCNTVFSSTWPWSTFRTPWTNSLFENAPAVALGVRARWDQEGHAARRLWVVGGDGAMLDIGFQSLSRLLMSGRDVKVLVLDTQVYSNTGGQASTASFTGQETKMSYFGAAQSGKSERRKELGLLALMHPDVFVAQTTPAHPNHFYRAVLEANAFPGPALVNAYAVCQPEHGVADDAAFHQAKLAAASRAFPLFIHDPRRGEKLSERLDLKGNPAPESDWYVNPKTGEAVDFVSFARTEGRFAHHFDKEGKPSAALLKAQEDRLSNWHMLQELAGLR